VMLVDAALLEDVPRVVHDTVTMVYADGRSTPLTEDAPVDAPGALAANLVTEHQLGRVTAAGGAGVALRLAPLYGPDDELSARVVAGARRGRVPLLGPVDGWTSALHTDDAGAAVLTAQTAPGGVCNVADDEPLTRRELLAVLADAVGVPTVRGLPDALVRAAPAPLRSLARSHRVDAGRFHAPGCRPSVPTRGQGCLMAAAGSGPVRVLQRGAPPTREGGGRSAGPAELGAHALRPPVGAQLDDAPGAVGVDDVDALGLRVPPGPALARDAPLHRRPGPGDHDEVLGDAEAAEGAGELLPEVAQRGRAGQPR